jgi:Rad52/22 family double-strand break repair protein
MVRMIPKQLAFFRALMAAFHESQLSVAPGRGGKEFVYIDKRALTNRLDTVCGPMGWYPEYEATSRGYKCRLYILVPTSDAGWTWMYKEDGAGFEEMGSTNRQTGQFEADVDNDEKSGYTNALRRAAQDAWGIGRYLYKKGVPAWFDSNATPEDALVPLEDAIRCEAGDRLARAEYDHAPSANIEAADPGDTSFDDPQLARLAAAKASVLPHQLPRTLEAAGNELPGGETNPDAKPVAAPAPAPAPAATLPGRANVLAPSKVERIDIPAAGRDVYVWARNAENKFRTQLLGRMKEGAGNRGLKASQLYAWPQEAVTEICLEAIAYIKTLATYRGEFDHLQPAAPAVAPTSPAPNPTATVSPNTGDPLI